MLTAPRLVTYPKFLVGFGTERQVGVGPDLGMGSRRAGPIPR
jgi:hypothetical protein